MMIIFVVVIVFLFFLFFLIIIIVLLLLFWRPSPSRSPPYAHQVSIIVRTRFNSISVYFDGASGARFSAHGARQRGREGGSGRGWRLYRRQVRGGGGGPHVYQGVGAALGRGRGSNGPEGEPLLGCWE